MTLKMLLTCPLLLQECPQICLRSSAPSLLPSFTCSCSLWVSQMLRVTSLRYLAYQPSQPKLLARLFICRCSILCSVLGQLSVPLQVSAERAAAMALTSPATFLLLARVCHLSLLFPISTEVVCASHPVLAPLPCLAVHPSRWTLSVVKSALTCVRPSMLPFWANTCLSGWPCPQVTCALF